MVELFEFEKATNRGCGDQKIMTDDACINAKYEAGEVRVVTEQGAYKLPLLPRIFSDETYYKLRPAYQRRITWDNKKRSRLIESFIMNIPVPPVFLYEYDYSYYEVMDGLQRISALIDFYKDKYALTGLTEWRELNGRTYSQLPSKIKEGIDRRQLQYVIILRESAQDDENATSMKRMVFERLNTGGVKLEDQEIRNALIGGNLNSLCLDLSVNMIFRKLWHIEDDITDDSDPEAMENTNSTMYMRMADVELVLRYFAMRRLDDYSGNLKYFLDRILSEGAKYTYEQLDCLKSAFEQAIQNAFALFGEKAFCMYSYDAKKKRYAWGNPLKFIYDPVMLAVSGINPKEYSDKVDANCAMLEAMYEKHAEDFSGKTQSKSDIAKRLGIIENVLEQIRIK